jgi:hypothetical protein
MAQATLAPDETYQQLLEKVTALSRGFLMILDDPQEKRTSFCRGLLILLNQLRTYPKEDN